MAFPDGVQFYPDIKDGIRGYNTDAARGADTFVPFRSSDGVKFYGLYTSNHTVALDDNSFFYILAVSGIRYGHITGNKNGTLWSSGNQSVTYTLNDKMLTINIKNIYGVYIFSDSDSFPS